MDKSELKTHYDQFAPRREGWRRRNSYYHETLEELCRKVIPPGKAVLELGCATGELLASVRPGLGVGVDLSPRMLEIARQKYPAYCFIQADAERLPLRRVFDFVILSDLVGHLADVWEVLRSLEQVCGPETRVIVTTSSFAWRPALAIAEKLGLKMPQLRQNWLDVADLENLFHLTDFEVLESGAGMLMPRRLPWLAERANRWPRRRGGWLARAALLNYFVVRPAPPAPAPGSESATCSVVVPCRNEAGNIAACVERTPAMGSHTELIFVDGDSTDGTVEEIRLQIERWRGRKDIKLIEQVPREGRAAARDTSANLMLKLGKGDAVRKGFAAASGEVLMILDADLTVPPEDLPKFFDAVVRGKGDFINGTRLVYPLADQAMKSLNLLGNKSFSWIFTWLLGQRIKDTLCGTKVLRKKDYLRIAANRHYFGEFDPFGDFDLLFGAARLGFKIVELPVRYQRRTAGESKVRVFRHGILLARMCLIGFWQLKARPWLARLRRQPVSAPRRPPRVSAGVGLRREVRDDE
ncbi:MAG: glycosyltransferase [Pyrinomonadaceae bacterium]